MLFVLVKRNIERHVCHSDLDIHYHIKEMTKTTIGSYTSDVFPSQGDIIVFTDKVGSKICRYELEVVRVIRVTELGHDKENLKIKETDVAYVEVRKYQTKKLCSYGSNSWDEDIPLIINLKEKADVMAELEIVKLPPPIIEKPVMAREPEKINQKIDLTPREPKKRGRKPKPKEPTLPKKRGPKPKIDLTPREPKKRGRPPKKKEDSND